MTLPKKAFQDQKFNFSSRQKFSVNDKKLNFFRWTQVFIAPYAAADVGEDAFETAVQQLIDYAYQRADEVTYFLSTTE